MPSSPVLLLPQAHTEPSDFRARANDVPAAIAMTPLPAPSFETAAGVEWSFSVPLPSSPTLLFPQARTSPFFLSAMLKDPPAAIATTALPAPRFFTAFGTSTGIVEATPLPTSPEPLWPQPSTEPFDLSAMLCPLIEVLV